MQYHLNGFKSGDPSVADASETRPVKPDAVDVLIVGCGPAGLTLAAQLAAFPEITTKITDQKPGPLEVGQADGLACRSIEMFEAVGKEYWNTYAQKLKSLLSTNGTAVLQVITIEEERFDSYSDTPDYIQRYIFPGGMLPSYSVLESTFVESGLEIIDSISFGNDYAKTLSLWRNQFLEQWPSALELGFDESFRRMWEFYLVYCETGFQQKSTDVVQITLKHM